SSELTQSKRPPPGLRPGIVARTALIERVLTASAGAVVCVVAPPGYGKTTLLAQRGQGRGDRGGGATRRGDGKTTLLAQWAQRRCDRVGWVTIDPPDNDPAVLLTYLAVALDRVAPIYPETFPILCSPNRAVPPH